MQPSTTTNNQSEQKASENENIPEPKPKLKRCPHINHIKKKIKKFHSISCEKCPRNSDADDQLVFCLSCFKLNCARTSSHAHGFNHWSIMTQHSLCMMIPTFNEYMNNTKDIIIHDVLTIWCYKCDSYLHELNQDNTNKIKNLKYEVYGCLQRGYKKLANKHKQKFKQNNYNNYNSVSVTPNQNSLLLAKHNKATREISSLKQKISSLKSKNATIIHRNNELTKQNSDALLKAARFIYLQQQTNDQQKKYNSLLEKYNKATRERIFLGKHNSSLEQTIEQKERNYNDLKIQKTSLNEECKELKTQNANVMERNNDLNEECKELKMELKDIKNKYNKWIQQNSDYTTWDYNTITDWIIGLDEQFIQYENELRKHLKQEEITGSDLKDLDKNDLKGFGIRVFKHKTRIMQEIQNLVMQKQNNNMQNDNNIIAYNEGKKDTAFIEQ